MVDAVIFFWTECTKCINNQNCPSVEWKYYGAMHEFLKRINLASQGAAAALMFAERFRRHTSAARQWWVRGVCVVCVVCGAERFTRYTSIARQCCVRVEGVCCECCECWYMNICQSQYTSPLFTHLPVPLHVILLCHVYNDKIYSYLNNAISDYNTSQLSIAFHA